uniref:Uncharacterized protein n=1 Tax=Meloidogyne enterolobii TaxID=390850 RepID=A0A6V7VYJ6_MELEN|nr:unnamed protein product [Meloidogyne enterolobii]
MYVVHPNAKSSLMPLLHCIHFLSLQIFLNPISFRTSRGGKFNCNPLGGCLC